MTLLALAMAMIGCNGTSRQNASASSAMSSSLNARGVQLATAGLVDDLLLAASATGNGVMSQQEALAMAKIDLAVSARTFESDYEANELAGDAKYKNKHFLLSGVIESIEKDFTGSGFLTLRSDNLLGVRAELNERGTSGAGALTKGTKIFLVCRSSDRIVGTEVAGDCQRLSQYVDAIRPDLDRSVKEYLSGQRAFPRKLGTVLTMMYVAGSHLPADSACSSQVGDRCEQEVMKMAKDPAQAQKVKAETEQMLAKLQLN